MKEPAKPRPGWRPSGPELCPPGGWPGRERGETTGEDWLWVLMRVVENSPAAHELAAERAAKPVPITGK